MKKAILFDRDGTLIVDKVYLNDPDAIEYLPNIFTALRALRDAGFVFFVATNQSGVPRGLVSIKNLNEIHRRIRAAFAEQGVDILDFYYAPYLTDDDHIYRKPNPGMLLQAAQEYNLDLGLSWMIGDRMTDVEAGQRAGTRTILLSPQGVSGKTHERGTTSAGGGSMSLGASSSGDGSTSAHSPDGIFQTVYDAVPFILQTSQTDLRQLGL